MIPLERGKGLGEKSVISLEPFFHCLMDIYYVIHIVSYIFVRNQN